MQKIDYLDIHLMLQVKIHSKNLQIGTDKKKNFKLLMFLFIMLGLVIQQILDNSTKIILFQKKKLIKLLMLIIDQQLE